MYRCNSAKIIFRILLLIGFKNTYLGKKKYLQITNCNTQKEERSKEGILRLYVLTPILGNNMSSSSHFYIQIPDI